MPEELRVVDNKTYIELKYDQRDLDNFKPYSYNQKKIKIKNEDPFKDGILLYLANLNTIEDDGIGGSRKTFKNEISLHLMPDSISEIYTYNVVSQSPYASMRPYYFYTSGSEKQISFTFQLHTDMLDTIGRKEGHYFGSDIIYKDLDIDYGGYKELYTMLQNYPVINMILNMSRPIYKYNNNNPELYEPLVYFQLGNQFAGIGYLNSSFKFSKPYDVETGTYKMITISMTITYMEEFDIYSQYQADLMTMGEKESWYRISYTDENVGYANQISEIAKNLGVIKLEETPESRLRDSMVVDNFLINYFEKGNVVQNVMSSERLQKLFNVENILVDFGQYSTNSYMSEILSDYKNIIQDKILNLENSFRLTDENLPEKYYFVDSSVSNFYLDLYKLIIEYLNIIAGLIIYEEPSKRKERLEKVLSELKILETKLISGSSLKTYLYDNPESSIGKRTFKSDIVLRHSLDNIISSLKNQMLGETIQDNICSRDSQIELEYTFDLDKLRRFYNFMTTTKTGNFYKTNQEFLNHIKLETQGQEDNVIIITDLNGRKFHLALDEDIELKVNTKRLLFSGNISISDDDLYELQFYGNDKWAYTRYIKINSALNHIKMLVGKQTTYPNNELFFIDRGKSNKVGNSEWVAGLPGEKTKNICLALYLFILIDYFYFDEEDYNDFPEEFIYQIYEAAYEGNLNKPNYLNKAFSRKVVLNDRWLQYTSHPDLDKFFSSYLSNFSNTTSDNHYYYRIIPDEEQREVFNLIHDLKDRINLALQIYTNIYTTGGVTS